MYKAWTIRRYKTDDREKIFKLYDIVHGIRSLAAEHQEIRTILREQNLGVARNRDFAIREANGELITWLDGDDFYYDNKIAMEWRALNTFSDGVSCSNVDIVDAGGAIIDIRDLSAFVGKQREVKLANIVCRRLPIPYQFLISKAIYERTGGIKGKFQLYEDWDFKIRLTALPVRWIWSGCVGMAYRQTGMGLSSAPVEEHSKAIGLILAENEALVTEILGADFYRQAIGAVPPAKSRRRARDLARSIVGRARRYMIGAPGV